MSGDKFTKGMSGDFRGDFSRDTFDPAKQFSRVLMQQGRVQLDADWNEQVSILLHYMRQLGRDLMGPHGAPYPEDNPENGGKVSDLLVNFKIEPVQTSSGSLPDFSIAPGRYYVNGICCENKEKEDSKELTFRNQHNGLFAGEVIENGKQYLVYLDVWERHISYVEDDSVREKALGGSDTATRAQVVWQVKTKKIEDTEKRSLEAKKYAKFLSVLKKEERLPETGQLKARAKKTERKEESCLTSPEATYLGAENQLYRVEIHNEGTATGGTDLVPKYATFKWSRENGSVIFPINSPIIVGTNNVKVTLEHLGRDDRFSLQPGDWVEVLNDDVILHNQANPLLQVTAVDREESLVTLALNTDTEDTAKLLAIIADNIKNEIDKHHYLRRWDHSKEVNKEGVLLVKENEAAKENWILIEDGIEIQFQKDGVYQTGDYWLIPARTATGDVEWPKNEKNEPVALEPRGVEHHYAPLAIITVNGDDGKVTSAEPDLRRQLRQGW